MPWFLVERSLPGMTSASLSALQRALRKAADRLSTPSSPVQYLGSIYVPPRETCLCLFQAQSPEQVRATNETAQAPYTSIHEAIALLQMKGEHP